MCSSNSRRSLAAAVAAALLAVAWGPQPLRADDTSPSKAIESETMDWKVGAEVGYRSLTVDGNEDIYQSQANLGRGVRLFNLSLSGTPKGPESRFFDTLQVDVSGMGGDPQQWVNFTLRKRGLYRWDVKYNRNDYVFLIPDFVNFGQHTNDNRRRTLESFFEMNAGPTRWYFGLARRDFDGPAFLTQDLSRDEFLVFAPVDRVTDDVRGGVDLKLGTWSLNLEETFRKLDSNSRYSLGPNAGAGNNPSNTATLTSFSREAPLNGTYWISRASAHRSFADRVDLSLSGVYSTGRTDGTSFQNAAGTYYTTGGPPFTEKIGTSNASDLPSTLAQAGVSIRITDKVYINETLSYHDYRIEGTTITDLDRDVNGTVTTSSDTVQRVTDWTSFGGRTEAEWRVDRNWTVRGGVDELARRVSFVERTDGKITDQESGDQNATTYFVNGAFHYGKKWSAFAEYQDGQVDNVFLRVDPADVQIARLRGSYRPTERWSFNLSAVYRHGRNPNPDVNNEVYSRAYALSTDYNGKKLSLSTGFTVVNLDSSTDIVYCTGSPCVLTPDVSLWSFIDNHVFADVAYRFTDRVTGLFKGQISDSRDSFPIQYYYVEPRVSVRVAKGYSVSLGYFRYEFDRKFDASQDYRATGGLFSVSATF